MPQNLFAACRTDEGLLAKRVRLDHAVQEALETVFNEQEQDFFQGVENEVPFDGGWNPDADEVLTIEVPPEAIIFQETISANPVAIPDIDAPNFASEDIRALFTGSANDGAVKVLVQRFFSPQILTRRFSLLQDGNTFRRLDGPAFAIGTKLACVFDGGQIKFKSFHNLRSIIDLMHFYQEATDQEVEDFADHEKLEVGNTDAFKEAADQTIRKLIHAIGKSGVLDEHDAADIQAAANQVGIDVPLANGKLVMPTTRADIKKVLRFLDDGLYEAPLSHQRYITNSKRPV